MWQVDQDISTKLDGLFDDRPFWQTVSVFFARYFLWAFLGGAIIIYRLINKTDEGALLYDALLIFGVLVPYSLTLGISYLVRRKRPYETMPDAWHLPIRLYTPSFPSGHSTIAFAVATFVCWYWHPSFLWVISLFAVAIAIALARVFVGVHYVTDVIVGAIIGSSIGWLTLVVVEQYLLTYFN